MLPEYADAAVCEYCGSSLRRDWAWTAEKEEGREAQHQRLRSIRCSQCAGPLSAHEGKRILLCDSCGVRVAVLKHGGLTRWYFPARVDRKSALAAGAAWLRDYPGIAPKVRGAAPAEAKLAYVPIWEHKVLTAGWEFGRRHRGRLVVKRSPVVAGMMGEADEALEMEVVEETVHESRLRERRFYLPAADFDSLGAGRPRITGRELLVPLVAGELDSSVLVMGARGEPSEVEERGRAAARSPLTGSFDPQVHLFLFREGVALLYYPLWLLRFRDGDSYCRVIVDGRDGTVNSGKAAADQARPLAILSARITTLVIAAAVFFYFGATRESARVPLLVVAVILSVAAVVLGMTFRPQKEVEYRDSLSC